MNRYHRLSRSTCSVLIRILFTVGWAIPVWVFAQSSQNTITQFQYDANGNLTQATDPLQQVTNFTIDPLNRVQQQQQPAPISGAARPTIAFTYDGRDQLSTVTDPRNLVTRMTITGLATRPH
jgi:YD repeat-containing protein